MANEENAGLVRILLVEDDPRCAEVAALYLKSAPRGLPHRLTTVGTLRGAVEAARRARFDVVLLDLNLPDSRGLETLNTVLAEFPETPVVVLTNEPESDAGVEAITRGAQDFLVKSKLESGRMWAAIRYALERGLRRRRLDAMLRGVADGIVVVDEDRTIRYANLAAAGFLRRPMRSVLGSRFPLPLDGRRREYALRGRHGEERVVILRVGTVDWDAKNPRLVTMHDITEIRTLEAIRAEVRLRKSQEEMRDAFLNNLFHEMRSPLTVAHSVLRILDTDEDNGLDAKSRNLVEAGLRNVDRMIRTVCDLLDLARLESGRAPIRRSRFSMREAVLEAVDDARHIAPEGLEIRVETPGGAGPFDVFADRDMTMQLLHNLIGNAARFARRLIRMRLDEDRGRDRVIVEVIDDGPGIPEKDLPDLFDRYHQAVRKGTGPYKGTGLGLPICRDLAALNGGEIEARNDAGGGGRIGFSYPSARRSGALARGVQTPPARGES